MRYLHAHHAGNFADVVKHVVLVALLRCMSRKPTPFLLVETHAGRGSYELNSPSARAGAESRDGILKLLGISELPEPIRDYVDLVRRLSQAGEHSQALTCYPGSPWIAAELLRTQDRSVFFELQAPEARALQRLLGTKRNVLVRQGDGFEGLKACLPPHERRGLVFIDPSYEAQREEQHRVVAVLNDAQKRWPSGIYAIWYPIKRRAELKPLMDGLRASSFSKILFVELSVYPEDSHASLNGCGIAIVNPPYLFEEAISEGLEALHRILSRHPATRADCYWLVH